MAVFGKTQTFEEERIEAEKAEAFEALVNEKLDAMKATGREMDSFAILECIAAANQELGIEITDTTIDTSDVYRDE